MPTVVFKRRKSLLFFDKSWVVMVQHVCVGDHQVSKNVLMVPVYVQNW